MVVKARFEAPGGKQFRVAERGGSRAVERRVFVPVLETERVNSRSPARQAIEISRRNYDFTCRRYDATARAYIFRVEPRAANKYLFRGEVWVNAEDFGIQRIEGEPAQRPSFWVRHTSFVHEYARFGSFRFPVHNRTEVELRLFGHSSMGIDFYDYPWEPRAERAGGSLDLAVQPLPLKVRPGQGFSP